MTITEHTIAAGAALRSVGLDATGDAGRPHPVVERIERGPVATDIRVLLVGDHVVERASYRVPTGTFDAHCATAHRIAARLDAGLDAKDEAAAVLFLAREYALTTEEN